MNSKKKSKEGLINLGALSLQSVIVKVFSFLQQMILLYVFGNSKTLAFYIFLKSFTSGITMFSGSNILLANLLPRFSKIYSSNSNVSLAAVRKTTTKISITIFFIVLLTLLTVTLFTFNNYKIDILTSLFLVVIMSVSSAVLFYTLVGLVLLQAKGEYIRFSYASITNHLTTLILIYPLSLISIVFSELARFVGIISQYPYLWKNRLEDKSGVVVVPQISFKDFDLKKIVNANYITLIALITNIQLGFFFQDVVVSFNYIHLVFNSIFTVLTMNVAAILLRNISIETKSQNVKIIVVIILQIIIFLFLYFLFESSLKIAFMFLDIDMKDIALFYEIFYAVIIPYFINFTGYILYQRAFVSEDKFTNIFQYVNILNVILYMMLLIVFSILGFYPVFIIGTSMSIVSVVYIILSIAIYTR